MRGPETWLRSAKIVKSAQRFFGKRCGMAGF
jgi:hypothetical protein